MSMPQEGQTATSKDGKKRIVFKGGQWVNDPTYQAPGADRAKTTPNDMQVLREASREAASERDALRSYSAAGAAVDRLDTGPVKAAWMDAITPDEDDGVLGKIGSVIGAPFRPLISKRDWEARDHLKTVNAQVALEGSQQMKGSSSDKDTALMRLSGIGPSKTSAENRRIVNSATYSSGLAQTRALVTSNWIAKYGSISNPAPNGLTYEQALQVGEQSYAKRQQARKSGRSLPSAPPSRRGGKTLTIDLDGNPIE